MGEQKVMGIRKREDAPSTFSSVSHALCRSLATSEMHCLDSYGSVDENCLSSNRAGLRTN